MFSRLYKSPTHFSMPVKDWDLKQAKIETRGGGPGAGGPAFNLAGEVVGVAFQSLSGGDNIGYLIPCDIVHHFLKQYRQVCLPLPIPSDEMQHSLVREGLFA